MDTTLKCSHRKCERRRRGFFQRLYEPFNFNTIILENYSHYYLIAEKEGEDYWSKLLVLNFKSPYKRFKNRSMKTNIYILARRLVFKEL